MDHEAVLMLYLQGKPRDLVPVFKTLPPTVDVQLVVDVIEKIIDKKFWMARLCKKLPPPVIRGVLARPMKHMNHLFLRNAVPVDVTDAELAKTWQHACETLIDIDTSHSWGSKQKRARIAKLVADKPVLAAIQATVAHSKLKDVGMDMLAVLAADGSDASYDALVGHIDAAFSAKDRRMDLLSMLRTHATKTPALDALFAELDGALQQRNDTSPALSLGPIIGVGEVPLLWFDVRLSSTKLNDNGVPWVQGSIGIDSRNATWFHASVTIVNPAEWHTMKGTSFTNEQLHRDDLGLGQCTAVELPRWIANTAAKLKITWEPFAPSSNLRGAKRDLIAKWLAGTPATAKKPAKKKKR